MYNKLYLYTKYVYKDDLVTTYNNYRNLILNILGRVNIVITNKYKLKANTYLRIRLFK